MTSIRKVLEVPVVLKVLEVQCRRCWKC